MTKPSREEVEKLIGKRTPLPGGKGIELPKDKGEGNTPRSDDTKLKGDPLALKKRLKDRMGDEYRKGGMTCAGKKYRSGGMVKGSGCEVKGKTKGKMK